MPLFSRAGRKVELTEAGRILADYVRQTKQLEAQALNDISSLQGEISGRQRFGALRAAAFLQLYSCPTLQDSTGKQAYKHTSDGLSG